MNQKRENTTQPSQAVQGPLLPAAPSQPSVSVCIGTYNQARYLRECIESVLAQTYPIAEIWVSDDASTDDTQQVMAEICNRNPTVRYHRHAVNLGIAANLSWALAQPSTELIARIDSDDRLEPEFTATLAGLMARYPRAGYGHCDVYEMDSHGARTRVRRLYRSAVYEDPEQALRQNAQGYRVAANCILYRASALQQADYFHANASWATAEDWDLAVRMAILGWGNVYAAQPLANYRVWDDPGFERFKRIVAEVEVVTKVYEGTLEPEYIRRGWSTEVLKRNRRSRAVGYSGALDSPRFTDDEREIYKQKLRELGDSASLSLAILLAEAGLNPLVRFVRRAEIRLKDVAKKWIRGIRGVRRVHPVAAPGALRAGGKNVSQERS